MEIRLIISDLIVRSAYPLAGLMFIFALIAAVHAIIYKREPRAAIIWTMIIISYPFIGAFFYLFFGINRSGRKAQRKEKKRITIKMDRFDKLIKVKQLPSLFNEYIGLWNVLERISKYKMLSGNDVELLLNGENAYKAMIEAIDSAEKSVTLSTYIFSYDEVGLLFLKALKKATQRGVEVRVLIDNIGANYSLKSMYKILKKNRIKTKKFNPTFIPLATRFINLRNHRKLMVVDGNIGFTGGMNIHVENLLKLNQKNQIQDIHFKIKGPVVSQIQHTFVEDWEYAAGELLVGEAWFPQNQFNEGNVLCRGINNGPDELIRKQYQVVHAAIASAQKSIKIMTPYFLPDTSIINALNIASLRGVKIEILIPKPLTCSIISWAITAQIWQVLEWDCCVYHNPGPFDHSKIMVIDDCWSLIGSSNWDSRSFRLNYEFNIECYSKELSLKLIAYFNSKKDKSKKILKTDVDSRNLFIKTRDGIARMLIPYL
jgi:cardiolipin synthase A/B